MSEEKQKNRIEPMTIEDCINNLKYNNLVSINKEYNNYYSNREFSDMMTTNICIDIINNFIDSGLISNYTDKIDINSFYQLVNDIKPYTQGLILAI